MLGKRTSTRAIKKQEQPEEDEDGNVEDAEIMDSYHEEAVDDVSSHNRGMIKNY